MLLVRQLQHGFTKNAKVSPNLTVAHTRKLVCAVGCAYYGVRSINPALRSRKACQTRDLVRREAVNSAETAETTNAKIHL